jgi:hypothetical protein
MTLRRRLAIALAAVSVVAALLAVTAPPVLATSGEITRAEANADWTLGSLAGFVEWTKCEDKYVIASLEYLCSWRPYATIGPGSQSSDCSSPVRDPSAPGSEVTVVWTGPKSTSPGVASFDVTDVSLSGNPGQLLCLSLVETAPEHVFCIALEGVVCPPYWMASYRRTVDSAFLTAPMPPPTGEEPEDAGRGLESGSPPEPTGAITRAEANADWTLGSIAGSVEWTGCETAGCDLTVYATVGSGSDASECSSADRQWPDLGEGVSLAWSYGGAGEGSGTAAFEVPDLALDGAPGQLLCLALVEAVSTGETIPCAPPGDPIPPGWHCPYVYEYIQHPLAAAFLTPTLEGPEHPAPEEPESPGGLEEPEPPKSEQPSEPLELPRPPVGALQGEPIEPAPSPTASMPDDGTQRTVRRRCRHRRHRAVACHRRRLHNRVRAN